MLDRGRRDAMMAAPRNAPHDPDSRMKTLYRPDLHSLRLLGRGKVRENYAVGDDRLLMVASDRISAFDVVMNEAIPGKGAVLTRMASFWFGLLADVVPNHLLDVDPKSVVAPDEVDQVDGRAMVVRKLTPLPIEAVVRGYLAGSGWKDYQAHGAVCGVSLPPGLGNAAKLPEPIFTPATKADLGEHDENIDFAAASTMIGADLAERVRRVSLALYARASEHAATRGIVIADTKFEFGLDRDGTLTLMDEVLTADSSRFWPAESYAASLAAGANPPSFDKQFLRDYLESVPQWNKRAPPPPLPDAIVARTSDKYREALERLTGSPGVRSTDPTSG